MAGRRIQRAPLAGDMRWTATRSSAPHRLYLNDVAPPAGRVSARDAMSQLTERGLAEVCSGDLEVYRLVMSPAEFKRLCCRLDRAVAAHWEQHHSDQADTEVAALPFGEDMQHVADRERRRQWADRPNGEPLPRQWTVLDEVRLPGRLKLVAGREFTATGVRGRLRFRHGIRTTDGEFWVEAFDRDGGFRSIHPDRVRRVHSLSPSSTLVRVARGLAVTVHLVEFDVGDRAYATGAQATGRSEVASDSGGVADVVPTHGPGSSDHADRVRSPPSSRVSPVGVDGGVAGWAVGSVRGSG